jgi:multiple sugar transport system ATP-binding protein
MARIELKGVKKSFQNLEVIHGVDLDIEDGAFTVFVGPSGCGKSTLLRMMAGLEELSAGEVHIDGARCDHLMPAARGMAMVFQSYALYPHMSVEQNLRFGLENARMPKAEIETRVARAADILQITPLLKRRPNQLSGGQSQRVAIGRAIVKEPKAFLFDEPLSNLDAELRVKMRAELIALHRRLGATMIYVTHDQVEAMTMADRIVVLRDGVIEQVGSPIELYARPTNTFVAGFLGAPQMNFVPGTVKSASSNSVTVALTGEGAELCLNDRAAALATGANCSIGVRPEHLTLDPAGPLQVTVDTVERLGAESIVHGHLQSGTAISASLRGITGLTPGAGVRFALSPNLTHLFDADGKTVATTRDWELDYRLE